MLSNLYLKYYQNPSLENLDRLVNGIYEYDFSDYEEFKNSIIEYGTSVKHNVKTNTLTTNNLSNYEIGPNAYDAIMKIEQILHSCGERSPISIMALQTYLCFNPVKRPDIITMNSSGRLCISVCSIEKTICEIVDIAKGKSLSIMAAPHVLNELTNNDVFLENQELFHSLINCDSPCFVSNRSNLHLNDQMINWKTGVNFYTCLYGNKHILPTFIKHNNRYYNLLNMHRMCQEIDDDLTIKEFTSCKCGRVQARFDFIPHIANYFNKGKSYSEYLTLAARIETTPECIQFVQRSNKILVFYKKVKNDLTDEDRQTIVETFCDFDVEFKPDEFFRVGHRKVPCFWNIRPVFI